LQKGAWFQALSLKCDILVSTFAFQAGQRERRYAREKARKKAQDDPRTAEYTKTSEDAERKRKYAEVGLSHKFHPVNP
jgi:hypothetical protein